MTKPRVAVIGTGGTMASIGKGPLDLLDYGANETMLHVDEIIARFPEVHEVTEFDIHALAALPRVDIVYAYTGADGTAVRAFVEAGAQGIVSAGFAPDSAGRATWHRSKKPYAVAWWWSSPRGRGVAAPSKASV